MTPKETKIIITIRKGERSPSVVDVETPDNLDILQVIGVLQLALRACCKSVESVAPQLAPMTAQGGK